MARSEHQLTGLVEVSTLRRVAFAIVLFPVVGLVAIIVLTTMGHLPMHAKGDPFLPSFELFAAVVGVVMGVVGWVVRSLSWRRGRQMARPDLKKLTYAGGVMLCLSAWEAGMLLNLVVMALVESPWPNLVVVAALLALALTSMPTEQQRNEVMQLGT